MANVSFVKIINIENSKTKYYFEGDKFLFSGCAKFVWDQTRNEVIDIQNDLCTLFFWPGGQINTPGYDEMDTFNVSADRTMLIGQNLIQHTFNYISMIIDEEICVGVGFDKFKGD